MATKERVGPPESTPGRQELDLGPIGPWAELDEFKNSQFFAELLNRMVTGRDMNIIVTAASETGVGKTTLACAIAMMVDQRGWTADKAAVASAAEYDYLYDRVPPGTALILDEVEKAADARRGNTTESVNLTQSFATKRYKQVFSILTAPSKGWVDKRLGSDAADYWIQAQETDMGRIKGEASVYRLRTNEHYETDYTERTETIHWPNIDDNKEFQKLDQRKRDVLETDSEQQYIQADKLEAKKKEAAKSATQQQRNEIIKRLNEHPDVTQDMISHGVNLSKGRVSQIVNQD